MATRDNFKIQLGLNAVENCRVDPNSLDGNDGLNADGHSMMLLNPECFFNLGSKLA